MNNITIFFIVLYILIVLLIIYSLLPRSPAPAPAPAPAPTLRGGGFLNALGLGGNNNYIPFVAGAEQTTQSDDGGWGNTVYLDRHDINCGNNGINRLHYQRTGDNTFQYQYNCTNGGVLDSDLNNITTGANDSGLQDQTFRGSSIYLDRHNVNCGDNKVMTRIHLNQGVIDGGSYHYEYNCAANKQIQNLKCRNVSTQMNDYGGGNSIYLDRHNIVCQNNEALSQLRLVRSPDGLNYQYQYTCCS